MNTDNKENQFYDRLYKYLFQNRGFIRALVRFAFPDKLLKEGRQSGIGGFFYSFNASQV
jgi:hypothetical protein